MRNILLLIDFSKNSKTMVDYAINFFGNEKVNYTIMNVYSEPEHGKSLLVSINDLLVNESQKGLEKEKERILSRHNIRESQVNLVSKNGTLVQTVIRFCKREDFDFVVIGRKGISRLKTIFFGSNAIDLIKKLNHPLLVVPENYTYKIPIQFGFGSDLKSLKDYSILEPFVQLIKDHQSNLQIVTVHESEKNMTSNEAGEGVILHHAFEDIPHYFFDANDEKPYKGLCSFMERQKIDLLTLVQRKHHLFERIFLTSTTKIMAKETSIPLLILKEDF